MRIIHSLEGESWSGGQQQAFFLALEQQKMGHEVLLVCQKGSVLEERAINAGVNVKSNDYRKEINPFSINNLLKIYDDFKPEIVNVHRAWAHTQWIIVSLLRRFKGLVVTRRVLFKPDFNPVSLVKYRTSVVRNYIVVSDAVKERLKEIGISDHRITVVYSATDTDRFCSNEKHKLCGIWPVTNDKAYPILMVGNYHKNKGHHLILEAFKLVAEEDPNIELVLAGHNTDSAVMKNMVSSLKFSNRVHLLGFREDVPAIMQKSKYTICASYQEGLSGTVRESLSLSVPVLASDIPANREINKLVPLVLFKSGDAKDFANKMLAMKESKTESIAPNQIRSQTVAAFSVSAMVEKTLQVYKDSLRGNN